MLSQCSACKEKKVKIRINPRSEVTRFTYRDERGRAWKRAKCPDCFLKYKKAWYRGVRHRKPQEEVPRIVQPPRFCRKCAVKLPATKYFYCTDHSPHIEFLDWEELGGIPNNGRIGPEGAWD